MPAHERSASRRYASNSKKKRSETVKDDNAKTQSKNSQRPALNKILINSE